MNTVAHEKGQASHLPQAVTVEDDPRWVAVERIVSSQNFAKSGRLNTFLLYIVRCVIEERTEELTEQQIGVQVFGRPSGYNPGEDNIVRTTARQLRQRLALYYQEEGVADPLRIQVPRGGYVPTFQTVGAPIAAPLKTAIPAPSIPVREEEVVEPHPKKGDFINWKQGWKYVVAVLLGAAVVLLIQRGISWKHESAAPTNPLWNAVFVPGKTTLYVPGDATLNLYNVMSGNPTRIPLNDYINNLYPPIQEENLANKHVHSLWLGGYVALNDLRLADQITQISDFRRERYEITFPHDLSPTDFHNANVILSGAPPYNPWVEMFETNLNFHFEYVGFDHSMTVINRHPLAGEPATYEMHDGMAKGYGYVALTDNLDGTGKVLLIEGASTVGVDVAASFLFDKHLLGPILNKAMDSHHKLSNFEVLLRAPYLKGRAGNIEVVATRFYPHR